MKKYLLIIFPIVLCLLLMACDFSGEINVSVASDPESSISSADESSVVSNTESKNESTSANNSESE
ncbi:MAG: hypothetical protein J6Q72_03370, partial [Clostridia bacterium]|nr:hypothetical protein [Clostridia bacterium]